MENLQFDTTKLKLKEGGKVLSAKLNNVFKNILPNSSLREESTWDAKQTAEHIYLVNQYLIKKVEQLIGLLHEGLVNESNEFIESDFRIVETMLNVSVFKIQALDEFNKSLPFSLAELELKLAVQVICFNKLTRAAPAAYSNNYLTDMKVIPGIKLDVYQLIHFGMKHMEHHLNQMMTLKNIETALQSEIPEKEPLYKFEYSF